MITAAAATHQAAIAAYHIAADGSLALLGEVGSLPAGDVGLAAS